MTLNFQKIYELVYQHDTLRDPLRKTALGSYGSQDNRDQNFIEWIQKEFHTDSKIFDASCGRGHLALRLRELGYQVEASEFCKWIIENELIKYNIPIYNLSYEELDKLPQKQYDCVCSNDVMEHLEFSSVEKSIENLCRLSKRGICFTISCGHGATKYPTAIYLKDREQYRFLNHLDLHQCVRSPNWWIKLLNKFIDTKYGVIRIFRKSFFYAGFVK